MWFLKISFQLLNVPALYCKYLYKSDGDFKCIKNMVMHHANWVIGVNNKIKLLEATRSNYEQQRFI